MKLFQRLRSPVTAFVHDLIMVPVAWFFAYWVRFDFSTIPPEYLTSAWQWLAVIMTVQVGLFFHYGLYRGDWRFASMPDVMRIIKAVLVGTLVCLAVITLATRLENVPRTVFPVYGVLLIGLLSTPRFFYRWLKDHKLYHTDSKRVLVVGAGRAGEMLVRDALRDPQRELFPVGFVDDQKTRLGLDIHGVRVLGTCEDIPRLAADRGVELILLAVPSANSVQLRRLVEICEQSGVPFRTLPCMEDLVAGRVSISALREVSIEDLLGRDPVTLDLQAIRSELSGKCVLISGAGGSIGSELCRQVARLAPNRLVLLENGEYNLYRIEGEIRHNFPGIELQAVLGSVTDAVAVNHLFNSTRPDVIYHAAAFKHVPMLESQVREAVFNNVVGTRVMAQAADQHGVDAFVLISTDKAVNPANIMGASKRIAEIYCQNLNSHSDTRYTTVRFGNVLDSAGSVVPLFRSQIEAGGPVTVTHPKMSRYFMTIPESCQLILQAESMSKGGEIFVLDMGEPVKITYLAEQMIRLSGKEPGKDIQIVYTALRPGEKLYEELFHEKEKLLTTGHEKILLASHRAMLWDDLKNKIAALERACEQFDETALNKLIDSLVPELHRAPVTPPDNVIPLKLEQEKQA